MIDYLLLDLDNTLYSKESGLGKSMGARMGEFVARYLKISNEEASDMRRRGLHAYGTTMSWLVHEHGLDNVEEFIDYVHPRDLDSYLSNDDRVAAQTVLKTLDLPSSVLTNAPREHADRILEWLGIAGEIDQIFDIRSNNFMGKPARSAYQTALAAVGARPDTTLFVDDVLQYVLPFRDMGGHAVHVSDEAKHEPGITTIRSLVELVPLVEQERTRNDS